MFAFIGVLCLLQSAILVHAQLITLRDGKVGVNFAGYHADAGLGGLLTGNSAHGGLSASAGTPWGSRAAAGLGGNLDGRTDGFGYAAAQANPSVGASALLGGSAGEHGYIGAEAHSPGRREIIENHVVAAAGPIVPATHNPPPTGPATSVIIVKRPRHRVKRPRQRQRTVYVMQQQQLQQSDSPAGDTQEVHERKPEAEQEKSPVKTDVKTVQTHKYSKTVQRPQTVENRFLAPQSSPVGLALDIPIGILRSLQQSLGNLVGGGAQPNAGVAPVQG
ncbi:GL17564 [Drosophila persimilis]|uniref:GL17564 n=1 Tax=Drosophila persimilis TaxID=7234 RepID=B4GHN6_DROPE|nr:GL17564 [Drosophila persimilis]